MARNGFWTSRQKTETTTRVPLLHPALEILDQYKDHPQCLNQEKIVAGVE